MILFRNCTVVDATAPEPREGRDVLVENERIREVSDTGIEVHGAWDVAVEGRTLMPGLIDAHAHVILGSYNLRELEDVPPTLMTARAATVMRGMLDRGFTSIRDAGGADWGLAKAVDDGLLAGPRLFISGRALSQTGGHGDFRPRTRASVEPCLCSHTLHFSSRIADGPEAVLAAARDELRKGANQIKVMASGGVASPHDPLKRTQFSRDELRAIVREAEAWGTYVMAHAYTAEAARHAVSCGVRSIEHGNLIDREAAAFMAAEGAYLVPTLATYEGMRRHADDLGLGDANRRKLQAVLEAGFASIEYAREAGVTIGFGSDLLGPLHHLQPLELTLRAEVEGAHDVIAAATRTNAALLGRDDLGVIAPGALADILIVDGDPLRNLGLFDETGRNLPAIMKGGVFHKNELPTTYRDAQIVPAGPPVG